MNVEIRGKTVNIKTVCISAKCSDLCLTELKDAKGSVVLEHDGYVPNFFPEEHYGDYVQLDIDMDTGKITNWKPTQKEVNETVKEWGEEHHVR